MRFQVCPEHFTKSSQPPYDEVLLPQFYSWSRTKREGQGLREGFPGGSDGKASACNAGDPGLIHGLGRSSGEGNGNPIQYSFLQNPMHRGAWQAVVHEITESDTTE